MTKETKKTQRQKKTTKRQISELVKNYSKQQTDAKQSQRDTK